MSPLVVFAICLIAAAVVGTLRSLELAKPLAAPAAPRLEPRPQTLRAPARAPVSALPDASLEQPEAA